MQCIDTSACDHTLKMSCGLMSLIMGSLNIYVYICDPKTYKLLYVSDALKAYASKAKVGAFCYVAFKNRDTPCHECPMQILNNTGRTKDVRDVFFEYLGIWFKVITSSLILEDNSLSYSFHLIDISDYQTSELELKKVQAEFLDPVTGGINFVKFKLSAAELMAQNPDKKYVLFYSDIKNFKYINDMFGFEAGNRILRKYSNRLGKEHKLLYARVNADNFVSIEEFRDESLIVPETLKRIESISDVSGILPSMPRITVFVGAYCVDGYCDKISIDSMIDRANIAQKKAKQQGSSGCIIYNEQFRLNVLSEQKMENRMHDALKNGEFKIYLQPKIALASNKIASAEALVRWCDPEIGIIPPIKFISLFEKNGFIKQLDTYVFEQVCKLIRSWIDRGKKPICISANVSKVQLTNTMFLKDYLGLKLKYNIPDGLLEIEFTESLLYDNSKKMVSVLRFFKQQGFISSIDDFGAGYSSLNILKILPVDILKLDKMFFDKSEFIEREKVILKNVIAMASELNMKTVAEGIECYEDVEFVRSIGCEMVQGYIFDKPLPVDVFEDKYIV